jgi:hypothetical protein
MKPEDRIRLQHMLDAARDALSFAEGHERPDLDAEIDPEMRSRMHPKGQLHRLFYGHILRATERA